MRILVLGGTAWLSGCIREIAVERGHDVTCLARGVSGTVPAGVSTVVADRDRDDAYDQVGDTDWDAIVDVSRQPGQVRRATAALSDRSALFVFVSSGSVYADHATPGADESAELLDPLAGDVMESMETYGEAKVSCERYVSASYGPDRTTIVRAGLIGGPGDLFGRSGYWPMRFAYPATDDGRVLVPDSPDQLMQLIDVRDLAAWVVELAAHSVSGVFNATGEALSLSDHLDTARRVAGHSGPVAPVDQAWLAAHEVNPWMGPRSLPLWLPMPEYAGFGARDNTAARDAGLVSRPLDQTLADVLAWELDQGVDHDRMAGLTRAEERTLLAAWASA